MHKKLTKTFFVTIALISHLPAYASQTSHKQDNSTINLTINLYEIKEKQKKNKGKMALKRNKGTHVWKLQRHIKKTYNIKGPIMTFTHNNKEIDTAQTLEALGIKNNSILDITYSNTPKASSTTRTSKTRTPLNLHTLYTNKEKKATPITNLLNNNVNSEDIKLEDKHIFFMAIIIVILTLIIISIANEKPYKVKKRPLPTDTSPPSTTFNPPPVPPAH